MLVHADGLLIRTFLDSETMMYSCGIFNSPQTTLADAQRAKLDALIAKAEVKCALPTSFLR